MKFTINVRVTKKVRNANGFDLFFGKDRQHFTKKSSALAVLRRAIAEMQFAILPTPAKPKTRKPSRLLE
ncbi:MAG: hypothetical protein NTU93_18670 [Arthrobacter sp.]|nr:hypothetical protein [Arthrobacter sp.]